MKPYVSLVNTIIPSKILIYQMPSFFNSWLPYIYLYGVGGIFFFFGMIFLTRIKAIDLSIKRHRNWFRIMIGGYLYFAFMHAFLIISALYL